MSEFGAEVSAVQPHSTPGVPAEARHRTLTLLDAVGAFETASDGTWLFVSARMCDMLDTDAQSLLGRGWLQFVHPEDLERVVAEYRQARDGHRAWRHRFRMVRTDGAVLWVMARGSALPQHPQAPGVAYIGTIDDVSADHREQLLVEEQARQLQALRQVIPIAVVVHRGGYILTANDAAGRMFGYEDGDSLIGQHQQTLVAAESLPRLLARQQAQEHFVEPLVFKRRSGETFRGYATSVGIDFEGSPARMIVIVSDSDPHVGAIIAKRRSELDAMLLDALPVPVHRVCLDHQEHPGLIQDANRAFCAMLGRTRDEVRCHSIFDFTAPEDVEDSVDTLRAMWETTNGSDRRLEKSYVRADGSLVPVRITAAPFVDPVNGRRCAYVVSEVVTDRGE